VIDAHALIALTLIALALASVTHPRARASIARAWRTDR
jgi:hypothetical protein